MRASLIVFLVLADASFSRAQGLSVDIDADDEAPAVKMQIRMNKPPPAASVPQTTRPPPPRTVGADTFSLKYGPDGDGTAMIKVLTPEGAHAQVWNEEGELEYQGEVPVNFKGRHSRYYRFILTAPDGQVLHDRKLELRQWLVGVLKMNAAPGAVPPPAAPVAAAAGAMSSVDFDALLAAVKEESFSDNRLDVVRTAAEHAFFSVDQVGSLVDALDHSGDKVKVVELTRSRLVDPANGFRLYQHFTFSGDKDKVKALLRK